MRLTPTFGALYLPAKEVPKLRQIPGLHDLPTDFPPLSEEHLSFNQSLGNALNIHVGSHAPDIKKKGIILDTLADGPSIQDPLISKVYKQNHPDERTLMNALDAYHIEYTRDSFTVLHRKMNQ